MLMRRLCHALILLVSIPAAAFAQSGRPEIIRDSHHDQSPPLREMPPGPRRIGELEAEPVRRIPSNRIPHTGRDPVIQNGAQATVLAAPSTSNNFEGVG